MSLTEPIECEVSPAKQPANFSTVRRWGEPDVQPGTRSGRRGELGWGRGAGWVGGAAIVPEVARPRTSSWTKCAEPHLESTGWGAVRVSAVFSRGSGVGTCCLHPLCLGCEQRPRFYLFIPQVLYPSWDLLPGSPPILPLSLKWGFVPGHEGRGKGRGRREVWKRGSF